MKSCIHSLCFAVCLALLFVGSVERVEAATQVTQQFMDSSKVWSASGSPYVISTPLSISKENKIEVEAGSTIEFNGGAIEILGEMDLSGSEQKPIHFVFDPDQSANTQVFLVRQGTLNVNTVQANGGSIRMLIEGINSSVSVIHSHFENIQSSDVLISVHDISTLSLIDDSFVDISTPQAVALYSHSNGDVEGVSLDHAGNAGALIAYDSYGSNGQSFVSAKDVTIRNESSYGMQFYNGISVIAEDLDISGSGGTGIITFGSSTLALKNVSLIDNDIGIEAYNTTVSLDQSILEQNRSAGVVAYGTSFDGRNNWWGDASGPFDRVRNGTGKGQSITSDVIFDPWLKQKPMSQKCCSNILFIPGIEASRLYAKKLTENQLWEPNTNADVEKLYMTADGKSINKDVYTKDVIGKTNLTGGLFDVSIYDDFLKYLDGLVSQKKIIEWRAAPYDWRYSVDDVAHTAIALPKGATTSLEDIFDGLLKNSKTGKVTILTHSNGGLVAKAFVKQLFDKGKIGFVDQLIMVAAPEYGTPQAIADMLHGDSQSILNGLVLSKTVARNLALNMPAAYGLLPSSKFFQNLFSSLIQIVDQTGSALNAASLYGSSIMNQSAFNDFLEATRKDRTTAKNADQIAVLNAALIKQEDTLHDKIDDLFSSSSILTGSIRVSSVVGVGDRTMQGLQYIYKKKGKGTEIERNKIMTDDGDGVVLAGSPTVRSGNVYAVDLKSLSLFQHKNYIHSNIMNAPSVQDLITDIIENNLQTLPAFTSQNATASPAVRYEFSVHSPVSIVAYDNYGNRTGLIKEATDEDVGYSVQEIPGSQYDDFGDAKTVILSEIPTKIVMTGLDTGTFRFDATKYDGTQETSNTEYSDIPVIKDSVAEFDPASTTIMMLDLDGDGVTDQKISPDNQSKGIDFIGSISNTRVAMNKDIENPIVRTIYLKKLDTLERLYRKGDIAEIQKQLDGTVRELSRAIEVYAALHKKLKIVKVFDSVANDTNQLFLEFSRLKTITDTLAYSD